MIRTYRRIQQINLHPLNMVETQTLTAVLTDIAYGGDAVAREDGRIVHASYGIPGERVELEVRRNKRGRERATVVRVLEPSPHRVTPPCPYFGVCGGCQWQHIDYAHQLELKRRVLKEQLARIGEIPSPYVVPTLACPEGWHYRNHARFSVDRQGRLGFTRPDSYRHLEIDYCRLMHPAINAVMARLQGRCKGTRQVSVRYGVGTGECLIQPPLERSDIGMESGQDHYHEALFGYRFRVSSPSFFQVNTAQAERMIGALRDRLCLSGAEVLVDGYGGVGTFAVLLAPYVRKIVVIEESPSAVEDARTNCGHFKNIELAQGKTENVLPEMPDIPDAVILDPPRAGCDDKVLESLAQLSPPRIVYVSCDPATLARDLRFLCKRGYRLKEALPVDMFPQTHHIETIATLELGPQNEASDD